MCISNKWEFLLRNIIPETVVLPHSHIDQLPLISSHCIDYLLMGADMKHSHVLDIHPANQPPLPDQEQFARENPCVDMEDLLDSYTRGLKQLGNNLYACSGD